MSEAAPKHPNLRPVDLMERERVERTDLAAFKGLLDLDLDRPLILD